MFFWGPIAGPGAVKKKGWLLRYELKKLFAAQPSILFFSFFGLEPDGCLVADQIRIRTNNYRKTWVQASKRGSADFELCPCKKTVLFCDGGVFFIDRGLLMGAIM